MICDCFAAFGPGQLVTVYQGILRGNVKVDVDKLKLGEAAEQNQTTEWLYRRREEPLLRI